MCSASKFSQNHLRATSSSLLEKVLFHSSMLKVPAGSRSRGSFFFSGAGGGASSAGSASAFFGFFSAGFSAAFFSFLGFSSFLPLPENSANFLASNSAILVQRAKSPTTALTLGWLMTVVNHRFTLPYGFLKAGSSTIL